LILYYAFDKCGNTALVYFQPPSNLTITISCHDLLAMLPQIFNMDDNIAPTLTEKAILKKVVQDLCSLVKKIFVDSWSCQIKAHQTITSKRAMTWDLKSFLNSATTQQATMVLNEEPSVNPKVLHNLIKTQVQVQNKKLQAELAQLNQKLTHQPATAKKEHKNHTKQKPMVAQKKTIGGLPKHNNAPHHQRKTRIQQHQEPITFLTHPELWTSKPKQYRCFGWAQHKCFTQHMQCIQQQQQDSTEWQQRLW